MNNVADQPKYKTNHMKEWGFFLSPFCRLLEIRMGWVTKQELNWTVDTIISFHVGHFPMKVLNIFRTQNSSKTYLKKRSSSFHYESFQQNLNHLGNGRKV